MLNQKRTYRLIASFLLALITFSSLGLTVQAHYCMDRLKGVSLLGKAKACHGNAKATACSSKKRACPMKQQRPQKGCCDDTVIFIDADLDLIQSTVAELAPVDQDFLLAYAASLIIALEPLAATPSPYQQYKPPLIDRDILVLVQSFLL